jgi:hypothetical protein
MKLRSLTAVAALLAGTATLSAQSAKFDGALIELYYTQMMDNNLRLNSGTHTPAYMALVTGSTENQFLIKRAEMYFSGSVTEDISWNLMFDPNLTSGTNTTYGAVLQDAMATWKLVPGFSLKVGQGKFLQSYESTSIAARNILFFDRSMVSRFIGERRDRGIMAQYDFGDPKGFGGKAYVAISNGMNDNGTGGKQPEANAQKDVHARLDFSVSGNVFGLYYRSGSTDVAKGVTFPTSAWGTAGPAAQAIQDNADKTTNLGLFYYKDTSQYQIFAEGSTGLLGRRFPSVFAAASTTASREHLDQKYLGYVVQGAYKMGKHWFTARYDFINYNSGDQWYTAYNPYTQSAPGVAKLVNGAAVDYSPKFTEITVGYNYVFIPTKYAAGKLKINYVMRSKNFLAPRAGQTGEQGGDSLVASLMVSF